MLATAGQFSKPDMQTPSVIPKCNPLAVSLFRQFQQLVYVVL